MILDLNHPDIFNIVDNIGSSSEPVRIIVIPDENAEVNECIPTVKEKVRKDSGQLILGWQIYHTGHLIEGVFHGVWLSPENELIDVTPKQPLMNEIIFLPDSRLKYEGKQIDSIRVNVSGSSLVNHLIIISELIFKLMNSGEREFQNGVVNLKGEDLEFYKYLNLFKISLLTMINNGQTKNQTCFCGGGKKYKICHGKDLLKVQKLI